MGQQKAQERSRAIPFSPSIYEHAARVINRSPWEVSRDGDLLAKGHIEAFRLYEHCPVVVGIDIYNLEAEAYGAPVDKPTGNGIPAISRHPLRSITDLLNLEPLDPQRDGRIPMVIEAARRVAKECPQADVRVPLSGPFSLTANLVGFESLLCEIQTDPDLVSRALKHLVAGQVEFCKEVVHRGLDIAFFESAATPPLLAPHQFRDVELGALVKIMEETSVVVGHPVPCIMGGDTLPILDYILDTGTGYVCCPAKTDQPKFMARMRARPDVMVRINMDPRGITAKNFDDVQKEVDRVLALADNREKVCIGTGCLPFEADPDVVVMTKEYVLSQSTR
ncbi:MAG: uroporphyrinogen decarboxylase family protein [Sedimentisphaerales bacterium]|jgi:uroporphyrinogen decarboxylase